MNYYPFHIGDYLSATRHLSWDEDAAYRRLLDVCYTTEQPLPGERTKIYRLVVAATQEQRAAVDSVLSEFFTQTAAGYQQERVVEELRAMQEKAEASAERTSHERERMARHRQRRAVMFNALRERGIVPPWDIRMDELQRLHDHTCNAAATDLQREQDVSGNAPATAIPTPTPIPIPKKKDSSSAEPTAGRFDDFWRCWPKSPRKVAKAECRKRWEARRLDAKADLILADVQVQKNSQQWRSGFEPAPLTYLNQARWEDSEPQPGVDHQWWLAAGFANAYEAANEGCHEHNADHFRDGKRVEREAA